MVVTRKTTINKVCFTHKRLEQKMYYRQDRRPKLVRVLAGVAKLVVFYYKTPPSVTLLTIGRKPKRESLFAFVGKGIVYQFTGKMHDNLQAEKVEPFIINESKSTKSPDKLVPVQ